MSNLKHVKPISKMNKRMLMHLQMKRKMNSQWGLRSSRFRPTGGLALELAKNANKYSKMFVQEA